MFGVGGGGASTPPRPGSLRPRDLAGGGRGRHTSHARYRGGEGEQLIPLNRLEEQKAQKEDRFLRGRQIAYLIYDHFRVTGSHQDCIGIVRLGDSSEEVRT